MKFCPQCGSTLDGDTCLCGYKIGMSDEEYRELHKDDNHINGDCVPIGICDNSGVKFGMLDVTPNVLPNLIHSYITSGGSTDIEAELKKLLVAGVITKLDALMFLKNYLNLHMDDVVNKLIDTINK